MNTHNEPTGLIGTAKQSWRSDYLLKSLGGLVFFLSPQCWPETSCQKDNNLFNTTILIPSPSCRDSTTTFSHHLVPWILPPLMESHRAGWQHTWLQSSHLDWLLFPSIRTGNLQISAQRRHSCSDWRPSLPPGCEMKDFHHLKRKKRQIYVNFVL